MSTKWPVSFQLTAGSPFLYSFTWYQNRTAAGEPENPVDLTGYTARFQGRTARDEEPASWDLTDGDGVTLGDALGTVDVEIPEAVTAELGGLRGVWAIVLVDPDGRPLDWLDGTWACEQALVYTDTE